MSSRAISDGDPRWVTPVGIFLCALSAAIAGLIEVLLIPLYVGSVIVPITLLLAVVSNAGLPMVVYRLGAGQLAAFLPIMVWIVVVVALSTGRPEGDVLVPGGGAEGDVGLALLGVGVVSGVVSGITVSGRSRRRRDPVVPPPHTGSGTRGGASTRAG